MLKKLRDVSKALYRVLGFGALRFKVLLGFCILPMFHVSIQVYFLTLASVSTV